MSSFTFLRLPQLVIGECLRHLNPIELLELSQCSKRTSRLISLARTRDFQLMLTLDIGRIGLHTKSEMFLFKSSNGNGEKIRIVNKKKFANFGEKLRLGPTSEVKEMELNWRKSRVDLFFHMLHTFNCSVRTLGSGTNTTLADWKPIIEHVRKRQAELHHITIACPIPDENELKSLLDTIKITREIRIKSQLGANFQYKFWSCPLILVILKSKWFTFQNLLECESVRIDLLESELTSMDLDSFLRLWKNEGACENLEYLIVAGRNLDDGGTILGMTPPIEDKGNREKMGKYIDDGRDYIGISEGVEVQRQDGVKAYINMAFDPFLQMINFEFFVIKNC